MNDFNLISCPLSGTHCISAGAGTGKTYAISHLFLRLLLEKAYTVNSILVVTFTEAATEELRDRIRELIKQALHVTRGGDADETVAAIVHAHIEKHSSDYTKAILYSALNSFDEASICTIHSFCQRILKDNAFESSMRFDTELITDQEPLILETVQDFWRNRFYRASPYLVNFAQSRGWTPQRFFKLIHNHTAQPDLKIIPKQAWVDTSPAEKSFTQAFTKVAEAWPKSKNEIEDILSNNDNLYKNKYKKVDIPHFIRALDIHLLYGNTYPDLFKNFVKFTASEIKNSTRKNQPPPEHPFFELCDSLYEQSQILCNLLEQQLLAFKYELFVYVSNHLAVKKQQSNVYTFDDLLTNLYSALRGPNKKILINSIRKKIKAALIDEFQDTDPVQYAIFEPLFAHSEIPLFLIGDPKQAIYSFRGADIFTFLDAVGNTPDENLYTLRTNRRSGKNLIQAFNTVFNNISAPFIYNGISYFKAESPAETTSSNSITIDGTPPAPLNIWYFPSSRFSYKKKNDDTYYPIGKGVATDILCKAVTHEISRLLTQGMINEDNNMHAITAGDIAVLVRTRDQAREMKQALSSARIPAVLHNAGNIFDSADASEINHFLHAVVYPNKQGFIRTALCSSLIGLNANTLHDATERGTLIEQYYDEFREYHNIWNRYGFIRMFTAFMSRQHIRKKLLSLPDGERRLTNVLHIQDLLQQQSTENRYTMEQLLNWFSTQLNPDSPRLEEHELRLEKDDNAVQIVTIHGSKGLEYPIVFCPFTWGSSTVLDKEFIFHDENNKRIYEIGSPEYDEHKKSAERELLAENLRLLYVAITRAKYQCYLAWGRFYKSETSAPAYLFHKPPSWDATAPVSDLANYAQSLNDSDMLRALNKLSSKSNGTIEIKEYTGIPETSYKPDKDTHQELLCKKFKGTIQLSESLSSFSSLIHKKHTMAEQPDLEEWYYEKNIPPVDVEKSEHKNIFTFPKGIGPGRFFHDILEQLDFKEKDPDIKSTLVSRKLTEYGFDQSWHDVIYKAIENLLAVNLPANNGGLLLSSISIKNTCREMEFYYPLKKTSPQKLATIFKDSGCFINGSEFPKRIESLDFQPVKGYMHGFIDLLFAHNNKYYIIDWKTNYLGDTPEYYSNENLKQAMLNNSYFLQYYIYTLAVDRYLASRIQDYAYEEHFGGVFYIFLRGISEDSVSKNGIFFDRQEKEIVERLSMGLINGC